VNTEVLAIDPGEVHCGMAWFAADECVAVEEMKPEDCVDAVAHWLQETTARALVIEEFRLYPWKAQQQSFSIMGTCEVIGQLKLAHRWHAGQVKLYIQPASIKEPTRAIMRARGIPMLAKLSKSGLHCLDAETHGYHHIHKKGNK